VAPSAAPTAPVDDAVAAPAGEADTNQGDDAQFEENQDATIMDVPIESENGPVQALGEFAIVSDNPDEVRRKILASASNFGLAFYGLLHKFGITQRPSVFLDGTPILGPAAEALNPAAYNTAAAAAGLTGDGDDMQVGTYGNQLYMETVALTHLVCEASIFMGYKVLIGGRDITCLITVQRISLVDRHTPSRQLCPCSHMIVDAAAAACRMLLASLLTSTSQATQQQRLRSFQKPKTPSQTPAAQPPRPLAAAVAASASAPSRDLMLWTPAPPPHQPPPLLLAQSTASPYGSLPPWLCSLHCWGLCCWQLWPYLGCG
jgi:hypothetical protein